MLKSKINTMIVLVLVGIIFLSGIYAFTRQYESVDYQTELNNIVHETVINAFDYSSRVDENRVRFDTYKLGEYVREGVAFSDVFAQADSVSTSYDILYSGEEIYGFRATVVVDGFEYHSTYVIDKKR